MKPELGVGYYGRMTSGFPHSQYQYYRFNKTKSEYIINYVATKQKRFVNTNSKELKQFKDIQYMNILDDSLKDIDKQFYHPLSQNQQAYKIINVNQMIKKTKQKILSQESYPVTQFNKQTFVLHIIQIKLLQPLAKQQQALISIRAQNNHILKELKITKNLNQPLRIRTNTEYPEVVMSIYPRKYQSGNKYDQIVGRVALSTINNVVYIYSSQNPNIGCRIKYELAQKNFNHFQPNSVIFDEIPQQQKYVGNIRKNKKKLNQNGSYQRHAFYQPETKIYQQTQEHDSYDQIFQEELDHFDRRQIKKKVAEASRILQQSLKNTQDQKKLFSRYLDQSTSFLKQLMGQLNQQSTIDLNKNLSINQVSENVLPIQEEGSQQQLNTQQRWYKNKFKMSSIKNRQKSRRPKLLKFVSTQEQLKKKVKLTLFINQFSQKNSLKKQISEIVINTNGPAKITSINFFVQNKREKKLIKFANLKKQDQSASKLWPIQIIMNNQNSPIYVNCMLEGEISEYIGCIGSEQQKSGECEIFNNNGQLQGYLYFKCKKICQSIVQTQDLISQKSQASSLKLNQIILQTPKIKGSQLSISKQKLQENNLAILQNQSSQNRQNTKRSLNSIKNQLKKSSTQTTIKVSTPKKVSIRNPQVTEQSSQTKQLDYNNTQSQLRTPKKVSARSPKVTPSLEQTKQIHKETIEPAKSKQTRFSRDLYSGQDSLNNDVKQNRQMLIKQKSINSTEKQANQFVFPRSKTMPNEQEEGYYSNMIRNQSSRNQRQQSNITKNASEIQLGQKREDLFQRDNKGVNTQRQVGNQFKLSQKPLQTKKSSLINLKISNLQLRLSKPNFHGIFLKILTSHQQSIPYFTQTSKQMFFLNWKGKGYLFLNLPISQTLNIQIFCSNGKNPTLVANLSINLTSLKTTIFGINQYEDVIKNQQGELLGSLIIQYQIFEKTNQTLDSILISKQRLQENIFLNRKFKISESSDNNLYIKKQESDINNQKLKNSKAKQRRFQSQRVSSVSSYKKSKVTLGSIFSKNKNVNKTQLSRKYMGGNIIIPKASRFKTSGDQERKKIPGPGQYQQRSQFQRHAIPL